MTPTEIEEMLWREEGQRARYFRTLKDAAGAAVITYLDNRVTLLEKKIVRQHSERSPSSYFLEFLLSVALSGTFSRLARLLREGIEKSAADRLTLSRVMIDKRPRLALVRNDQDILVTGTYKASANFQELFKAKAVQDQTLIRWLGAAEDIYPSVVAVGEKFVLEPPAAVPLVGAARLRTGGAGSFLSAVQKSTERQRAFESALFAYLRHAVRHESSTFWQSVAAKLSTLAMDEDDWEDLHDLSASHFEATIWVLTIGEPTRIIYGPDHLKLKKTKNVKPDLVRYSQSHGARPLVPRSGTGTTTYEDVNLGSKDAAKDLVVYLLGRLIDPYSKNTGHLSFAEYYYQQKRKLQEPKLTPSERKKLDKEGVSYVLNSDEHIRELAIRFLLPYLQEIQSSADKIMQGVVP